MLKDFNYVHWNFKAKSGVTSRLAENISAIGCGDIPDSVTKICKAFILDALGCMLKGAKSETGVKALNFVKSQGGTEECGTVYYRHKTNRYNAAFLNGSFCHTSFLENLASNGLFLQSAVVSAALAVAEKDIREGIRLLEATILGFETVLRLAESVVPFVPEQRPLNPTAVFGPFGAAVAAGKLLGFDARIMENAISLCPAQAAATSQSVKGDDDLYGLQGGFAASWGLRCAYLAQEGLSGARDMLEGKMGFFQCIGGLLDDDITPRYSTEKVNELFGEKWFILQVCSADPQNCGDSASEQNSPYYKTTDTISWSSAEKKFKILAEEAGIKSSSQERIIDMIGDLEKLDNTAFLMQELSLNQ